MSLTRARDEVPIAAGLRLFLPESRTRDPPRMARAGVPEAFRRPRSKPEIALAESDRLMAAGALAPFLPAPAMAWLLPSVGGRAPAGLGRRRSQTQKIYPANVFLIFSVAKRGRPRKNQIPDRLPVAAETMRAKAKGKKISWRGGLKGPLSARLAVLRIRIADGPPRRILDKDQQHLPGEEAGLAGESARASCMGNEPWIIPR